MRDALYRVTAKFPTNFGKEANVPKKKAKPAGSAWDNDQERERLLMQQLPQVRYIARRIHDHLPRHVLLDDLVHAGVLGLIDALQKFDAEKHVQFGSYAKFRIRGAIID